MQSKPRPRKESESMGECSSTKPVFCNDAEGYVTVAPIPIMRNTTLTNALSFPLLRETRTRIGKFSESCQLVPSSLFFSRLFFCLQVLIAGNKKPGKPPIIMPDTSQVVGRVSRLTSVRCHHLLSPNPHHHPRFTRTPCP